MSAPLKSMYRNHHSSTRGDDFVLLGGMRGPFLKRDGMFVGSVPNAFSLAHRFRYMRMQKEGTLLAVPTHINHFTVLELRSLLEQKILRGRDYWIWTPELVCSRFPSVACLWSFSRCSRYKDLKI